MNKRVLKRMHKMGLITDKELASGKADKNKYYLYLYDVSVIKEVKPTISAQLQEYRNIKERGEGVPSWIDSQIEKLEKAQKDYYDNDIYGVGGTPKYEMNTGQTQKEVILQHIKDYGHITSWEAFMEYGVTRLAGIIFKLRHREGMNIKTDLITKRNRYGNPVNFAKYTLEQ